MRAAHHIALIASLISLWPVAASAELSPVDVFDAPLRDHRRLELVVPPGFDATCTDGTSRDDAAPLAPLCTLTAAPEGLFRLLGPLHDGLLAEVVMGGKRGEDTITFRLAAKDLRFRQKVFDLPRRWVIEIGRPQTMSAKLEDEQPFRPYPMKLTAYRPPLPLAKILPLAADAPLAQPYHECLAHWRQGKVMKALRACEALIASAPPGAEAEAVSQAWRIVAEARYSLALDGRGKEDTLLHALTEAEGSLKDPHDAFRYVAMAVSWLGGRAPGKASKWLRDREARYMDSPAAADYRAALAGLLMKTDERSEALPLLEEAGRAPVTSRHARRFTGYAKLALAALAYEGRRYRKSLMIYDRMSSAWPGLLMEDPQSVFRYAEVLNLVGRHEEAKRLYTAFLELTPQAHPAFMAKIRLAQMVTMLDLEQAKKELLDLKQSLPGTQAQNLALLQIASLTNKPEMRRPMLKRILGTAQTDYIRGAVQVAMARQALSEGDLRGAYEMLKTLRAKIPEEPTLQEAPGMWLRVLYQLLTNYLYHDRPLAALSLFHAERAAIEGHPYRAEIHFRLGRAMRQMGALEEALSILQGGLSPRSEAAEPDAVARIYLEMAGVLREAGDRFRMARALDYLDRSFPKRFDNFEYWLCQATRARWEDRLEEARDILRYAINGPVSMEERVTLAETLARVYEEMEAWSSAVRAWEAVVSFYDEVHGPHRPEAQVGAPDPQRRGALWRAAEIEFDQGEWINAVAALDRFIADYPLHSSVPEARFLMARSLLSLGSTRSAIEVLDRLSRQQPEGVYSRLAKQELELLSWRRNERDKALSRAGLQ